MSSTSEHATTSPVKRMRLRYAGTCRVCGTALAAGATATYDRTSKAVTCLDCPQASAPEPVDVAVPDEAVAGVPGASARREHDRRSAQREARVREAHPHLGGLILALSDDPQSTRAWAQGARGEELLGARLNALADQGVRALHDRRIPRSKANIDHIVVGPAGVHVIDAKRYLGKRPERRVEGGLFRPRTERLVVGSRDSTSLLAGVHKQVTVVRAVLDDAGLADVAVHGVLCFLEADWPLIGGDFTIDDVKVLWPKKLAGLLTTDTPVLTPTQADSIHRCLAEALPPA